MVFSTPFLCCPSVGLERGRVARSGPRRLNYFTKEAIEDGIGAGRGDSNHVADHEGQHNVLCNIENYFTLHTQLIISLLVNNDSRNESISGSGSFHKVSLNHNGP